jgi:hypothetical protein
MMQADLSRYVQNPFQREHFWPRNGHNMGSVGGDGVD